MDVPKVPLRSAASELAGLLDSPEIADLIRELEETRWTGRPGYPLRSMVGMALAKSLYAIRRGRAPRGSCASTPRCATPSARCRLSGRATAFTRKLREHCDTLATCLDRVTASLHAEHPDMGRDVAIDASDMPAYANGQRFVSKNGRERSDDEFSDPDASWGHRSAVSTRKGGGFYGYRIHAAVCANTGLPLAWQVQSANAHESTQVASLLDTLKRRDFAPATCALDKGYDVERVYGECEERDVRPIIPIRETPSVVRGDHLPPTCEHGEWRFAGSDAKRGASKWRCPTGGCQPASRWVTASRLHPLLPRETPRWRKLYKGRASIEREFGRLKNEWALAPLRVRGLDRVRLHADLTILAKLSCALAKARVVPLAAQPGVPNREPVHG